MNKIIVITLLIFIPMISLGNVSVRTNLLSNTIGYMNIGSEIKITKQTTVELNALKNIFNESSRLGVTFRQYKNGQYIGIGPAVWYINKEISGNDYGFTHIGIDVKIGHDFKYSKESKFEIGYSFGAFIDISDKQTRVINNKSYSNTIGGELNLGANIKYNF